MYVKLQSGTFDQVKPEGGEVPGHIDRKALLVYAGNFESMDGMVEVKDEHIVRLHNSHNEIMTQISRMAAGDVPLKYCPPIQLDHSNLAKDTVGRLYGPLEMGEHHLSEGHTVKALYGNVRILGRDNVEKVLDGRWTHLSIGADLETGKFQELTITPFPAAPDASMLRRMAEKKSEKYNGVKIVLEPGPGVSWYIVVKDIKRGPFQKESDAWEAGRQIVESGALEKFSRGFSMWERLKSFVMRRARLSAEEAEKKLKEGGKSFDEWAEEEKKEHERMKKHLTQHKKMSEEEADKRLGEMNVEEHKKLAAEIDEHEKKMAAEKPKEEGHEAGKLSAASLESLTRLSTSFQSSASSARLSLKRAQILSRLSGLKTAAKITPAELKKVDVVQLSKENDATIEAVLKSYEDREPVILTGMTGSNKGVDMSNVSKQVRMAKLEMETRANMPFLSRASSDQLKEDRKRLKKLEDKSTPGTPSNTDSSSLDEHQDAPHEAVKHLEEIHKEAEKHMKKIHAAMDSDNKGEAKEHLGRLMEHYKHHMAKHAMAKHMAEEPSEKSHAEMSALAAEVQKMQNDVNEILRLAGVK